MTDRIIVETQMTEATDTSRNTWSDDKILEELSKEFPAHQLKVLSGKFSYIPEPLVRNRLDEVLGLNWSWEITRETETIFKKQPAVVVTGKLTLHLPSGAIVVKEAHGGAALDNGYRPGDAHKSAGSNALKKAAYLAGIGAYLGLSSAEGMDDTTAWGNSSNTSGGGASWASAPVAPQQGTAGAPQVLPVTTTNWAK